jgi:hypothetical protein
LCKKALEFNIRRYLFLINQLVNANDSATLLTKKTHLQLYLRFGRGNLSFGKHFVKISEKTSIKHSSDKLSEKIPSSPATRPSSTFGQCGKISKFSKHL